MSFPYNIYLAAGVGAWLTTSLALPLWRKWCERTGLVDDPGHRKIHDRPIVLAGGPAVMTGLVVPVLLAAAVLWCRRTEGGINGMLAAFNGSGSPAPLASPTVESTVQVLVYGLHRRILELAVILAGAAGMLLVGLLDDKYELRPRTKFAGQFLIALLVASSGARITLFVPSLLFSYAVTVLWILTLINAFNFMDNMNGLCAGLGAIGAWCFALLAAGHGQYLVALIAFLTCGALLGFLPYNFPRATAFLGDAGSHLVGYLLAVLAILPHFYTVKQPHRWAVLFPLLILAVPLGDMAWVVVWRWRHGKPFYVGDTNHLSHRLVRQGLSRTRAVLVIWLLAAAAGAVACLV